MSDQRPKKPMVKITVMYENVSKNGMAYFGGYMGNARVLMFRDRETTPDGKITWSLFVQEKDQKPDEQRQDHPPAQQQGYGPPAQQTRHPPAQQAWSPPAQQYSQSNPVTHQDDDIPF